MAIGVSFGNVSDVQNVLHKDLSGINTGTDLDYDCEIKQPCAVDAPVFVVGTDTDLKHVNYAFCRSFGRYYFVVDVSLTPEGYVISCVTDALTTAVELYGLADKKLNIERTSNFRGNSNLIIDTTISTLAKFGKDRKNFVGCQLTPASADSYNYVLITV